MKIVMGNRQTGKTTELIKMSAETGAVIVVSSHIRKHSVLQQAKQLGVEIPPPVTLYELEGGKQKGKLSTSYLIDELEDLLNRLTGGIIKAIVIDTTKTQTEDFNKKEW